MSLIFWMGKSMVSCGFSLEDLCFLWSPTASESPRRRGWRRRGHVRDDLANLANLDDVVPRMFLFRNKWEVWRKHGETLGENMVKHPGKTWWNIGIQRNSTFKRIKAVWVLVHCFGVSHLETGWNLAMSESGRPQSANVWSEGPNSPRFPFEYIYICIYIYFHKTPIVLKPQFLMFF